MTRNDNMKRISLLTGAALALGVTSAPGFAAETNPFGMTELKQGFQVAGAEAKCGGSKASESKCGDSKAKSSEGKCGSGKAKTSESKCGEGKCGAAK